MYMTWHQLRRTPSLVYLSPARRSIPSQLLRSWPACCTCPKRPLTKAQQTNPPALKDTRLLFYGLIHKDSNVLSDVVLFCCAFTQTKQSSLSINAGPIKIKTLHQVSALLLPPLWRKIGQIYSIILSPHVTWFLHAVTTPGAVRTEVV